MSEYIYATLPSWMCESGSGTVTDSHAAGKALNLQKSLVWLRVHATKNLPIAATFTKMVYLVHVQNDAELTTQDQWQ